MTTGSSSGVSEDRPIRWGLLGAGGIAEKLANDIGISAGNEVVAISARDPQRAAEFAGRYGVERSYGNYEALVADADVDVVYVATTHPGHRYAHALLAIESGKAVLIEKPLCLNAADARVVFDAARTRGVFAMEAMWTRLNPLVRQALQLVADGAIGEVRGVRSEFGLGIPFTPTHRLYDLANGGGALLDIGIYPATLAFQFLGRPDEVVTTGVLAASGADETAAMNWLYDGEPRAQLWCSLSVAAPNEAAILGTHGWIKLEAQAHRPSGLLVRSGADEYHVDDPIAGQGHGFVPEIAEVERCLRAGLTESPLVPMAETIAILEILDGARAALGVVYPSERR